MKSEKEQGMFGMNDFKEQYRQELINQEIKSNKRTVQGFIWFLAVLTIVWLLNVIGFFELDQNMITITLISVSVLLLPPVYVYFRGDLSKIWLKYVFLTLMCIVSGIVVSFLSFHAVLLYVVPLLFAVQYRRKAAIWFVYAVNAVTMTISSLASFYYGICDLNILFQSQHTRNWYLNIITEHALNIPFNEDPVFVILVFAVFPRCIILFLLCIMMQYMIVSSSEDAFRIAQLTYLKETDARTRVFNKNKYFEMVTEYYPGIEKIAAVFWDLNNLKYINDQYGHAVGDRAIERLSSALNCFACDRCRIYRIGGDEFLMILDNPAENEAEVIMKTVRAELEKEYDEDGVRISSASGLAFGKGKNILKVVEEADAHMYENKRSGREHREADQEREEKDELSGY